MGTVNRGTKSAGGTNFSANTLILSAEVNTDLNTLYTLVNGNIDNANIASTPRIDPEKIDDQSATDAEQVGTLNPGTSDSQTNATSLQEEIQSLRYAIERLALGIDTDRNDGAAKDTNWIDIPYRPGNLVRNGSFEVKTTAAGAAPDGWTLVGTPTTLAQAETAVSEGEGKAIDIVADAASEGISQTLAGLKASTNYLIIARVLVNTGTCRLVTTGGATTGEFRNVDVSSATTGSYETLKAVVATDATPSDLVVQLISNANLDDFHVDHVGVYECNADPVPQAGIVSIFQTSTAQTPTFPTASGETQFTPLDASVTVPGPGYEIHVGLHLNGNVTTGTSSVFAIRIKENGSLVAEDVSQGATGDLFCGGYCEYVNTNPTVGTTYQYTVFGESYGGGATVTPNANSGTAQPIASLKVQLVKL